MTPLRSTLVHTVLPLAVVWGLADLITVLSFVGVRRARARSGAIPRSSLPPEMHYRFWGGPRDGESADGIVAFGVWCDGGVYRYDAVRRAYVWHQHVPPSHHVA